MASGDFLFDLRARSGSSPAANAAQIDIVQDASTPAENMDVIAFDAGVNEYMDFILTMPAHYVGTTGITCLIEFQMASDTANAIRAAIALRRRETSDDWDTTAHTYDYNEATLSSPATVGLSTQGNITFTDGADMDSVAAGDEFVLRLWRDYNDGGDTASGDAYIERIYATET